MFKRHNKYTIAMYSVLGVSSFIGFYVLGMLYTTFGNDQPLLTYVVVGILSVMLLLNTYFAYLIYKGSLRALRFSFWLYAVQILGFDTGYWALSLNFGMNLSISFNYETTDVTINMLAIIICVIAHLAYRSIAKGDAPGNSSVASTDGSG